MSDSDPRSDHSADQIRPAADGTPPDVAAFRELEQLLHLVGEEVGAWRRRAHVAESRVRELERALERRPASAQPPGGAAPAAHAAPEHVAPARLAALEREKADLEARLEAARGRTRQLLDRIRFLRQQHDVGAAG